MGDPIPILTFLNVVGLFKAFKFMVLVFSSLSLPLSLAFSHTLSLAHSFSFTRLSYQLKGTTDKLVDTQLDGSVDTWDLVRLLHFKQNAKSCRVSSAFR